MTRAKPVKLAVMGAGLIGRRHVEHILAEPSAALHGIVDPADVARDYAHSVGADWYPDFTSLIASGRPDGVIIATPNQMHVNHGLEVIAAGLPALVEKPISDDPATALSLIEAGEKAGIPILTGHHRRHNPMIQRAKSIVESGRLGRLVTIHSFFWLMKPDDYFVPDWRRRKGAGPVMLNMIHDIDLMRYLCGEVEAVQAFQSNAVRGNEVDETTVVSLRFVSGVLGTMNISDTVVAPWSWEHTTGENPGYPKTDQPCYMLAGTHGSLSIPRLEVWSNAEKRSWWEPFETSRITAADEDPLRVQVRHFCKVIRGEEQPVVSGREGLMTLRVIDAVQRAARSGQMVTV